MDTITTSTTYLNIDTLYDTTLEPSTMLALVLFAAGLYCLYVGGFSKRSIRQMFTKKRR